MSRLVSARQAAWGWLRSVGPQRRYLGRDLLAGLPGAVSSVPDGMAAAILAGVNPVQGLYASFAGPITGGLSANTRLMVITTTSASALATASALSGVPAAQRPAAVPLVAIIAGAALVAAGLLKLGRYTRFVSYSVMTGFLTGVAVNIVCGQIPDLTGAPAKGAFPLAKAINVLVHPSSINLASLLTGLGALAILLVMSFTPGRVVSALVALIIPTAAVALAGAASVARVGDAGDIPPGIPLPRLPDFGLVSLSLVTGALAVVVHGGGFDSGAAQLFGGAFVVRWVHPALQRRNLHSDLLENREHGKDVIGLSAMRGGDHGDLARIQTKALAGSRLDDGRGNQRLGRRA